MNKDRTCPECKGAKMIVGRCECDSEWRSAADPHADDCICEPDHECPVCNGKGVI